ncbi:hypothetical protein [Streptomyces sp. NPDC000410]|uniref:hypothetical protein n=1 Tax=Streptomyces sp. NPDC000410 TaxID=3154254 RepID=UPI00332167F5
MIFALAVTYETDIGLVTAAIGNVLLAGSIVMQFRHRFGRPCVECVKEMPLNPAESAREDRNSRWGLRVFHSAYETLPRFFLSCTVHLGIVVLACSPLYGVAGMESAAGAANVFLGLGLSLTAVANWTTRTHGRLAPWCPYCDGGEEDDDESPVDDPTGGRDHPVPA